MFHLPPGYTQWLYSVACLAEWRCPQVAHRSCFKTATTSRSRSSPSLARLPTPLPARSPKRRWKIVEMQTACYGTRHCNHSNHSKQYLRQTSRRRCCCCCCCCAPELIKSGNELVCSRFIKVKKSCDGQHTPPNLVVTFQFGAGPHPSTIHAPHPFVLPRPLSRLCLSLSNSQILNFCL